MDDFTATADLMGVGGVTGTGSAALGAATDGPGFAAGAAEAGEVLIELFGDSGLLPDLSGTALTATGLATDALTGAGFAGATVLVTGALAGAALLATTGLAGLALVFALRLLFTGWVTGLAAGFLAAALATVLGVGLATGLDDAFRLLAATVFFFAAAALLAAGLLVCFCVLAGFFAGILVASMVRGGSLGRPDQVADYT
ncbi:MAG: hypothetical protein AB7T07_10470 [Steroidobacteraceae bacterium]